MRTIILVMLSIGLIACGHKPNTVCDKYAAIKTDGSQTINKVAKFLGNPVRHANNPRVIDFLLENGATTFSVVINDAGKIVAKYGGSQCAAK